MAEVYTTRCKSFQVFVTDSLVHDWQTKGQSSLLVKVLTDQSSGQEAMQTTLHLLWKPMRMPDRDVCDNWTIHFHDMGGYGKSVPAKLMVDFDRLMLPVNIVSTDAAFQ